jgi:hypothetical protein
MTSAAVTKPQSLRSLVPAEVSTELQRVVERWRQLPLDHALSYVPQVRALVQSLADQVAQATGIQPQEVPDLGPATLMDQLTVLVYDISAARARAAGASATQVAALTKDLATLRRELH